ncbi:MAG: methyltransferase [Terrimonas sp.]|nr:methyltransferase [Terrimonas sp.]
MEIIDPGAESYAASYSSPESDLLKEIAAYTTAHHPEHHMLSGHLQGKLLEMISMMIRPRRILEIGTFTGYSAICLAKGLRPDGKLHTIEMRDNDADIASGFFKKAGLGDSIILHRGKAAAIIPLLDEQWDLVFIDADKTGYLEYFNLVLPKLSDNGFILADNIYFHGQVLDNNPKGKHAKAISAFNRFVRERTDIEKLVLTIRDGLFIIRKSLP